MDSVLLDPFVRLLREVSPPAAVRRAEVAGDAADILRPSTNPAFSMRCCLRRKAVRDLP